MRENNLLKQALNDSQGKHGLILSVAVFSPTVFEYIVSHCHLYQPSIYSVTYMEWILRIVHSKFLKLIY